MKGEYCVVLIITMGLIFGSLFGATPQVMTEHYSYASTDTDEQNSGEASDEDTPEQQQDDSEIQSESEDSEFQSESEDEDEIQTLSGVSKKDTKSPTIDSRSPNVGTVQIPVNTNIKVTFSEPVQSSTVATSTFQLKIAGGATEVPGSVSLSSDGKAATLDPTSDLAPLQSYTVSLTSGVKDLAGNSLNSENWSFTTEGQSSGGSGGNTSSGGSTSSTASDPDVLRGSGEIDILQEAAQFEADSKLLDRLLPILYKKIDMNALIANADGKKLLEKVLPYLDVKVIVREQVGAKKSVQVSGFTTAYATSTAQCNQDEVSTGGGYELVSIGATTGTDNVHSRDNMPSGPNSWFVQALFDGDGQIQAFAQCMKVEVGIKGAEGLTTRSGTIDTSSDLGIKTSENLDILKQPVP